MKKPMFLKFIVFILAISLFSSLAACGDTAGKQSEIEEEDEYEYFDLDGYEFDIMGYQRDNVVQLKPDFGASARGDALLAHYKSLEEKFNMVINAYDGELKHTSTIPSKAAVGDKSADIADMFLGEALILYKGGYLHPLNSFLDDDELFSGKYGTETQLDAASMRITEYIDYYAFKGAYWGIPAPSFSLATYFNPDFLKQFDQPSPYELYEQKLWTWEQFETICKALISQGNDPASEEDDTFGLPNDPAQKYVPRAILRSNGVKGVYYDESEGVYKTDMNSSASLEALSFTRRLVESGAMKMISGSTQNTYVGNAVNAFITSRCGFLVEYTYHGLTDKGSMSYADGFQFDWICFPWGTQGTYGEMPTTISTSDHYITLPYYDNADILEAVLPVMFKPFEGDTETSWQDEFSRRIFFDGNYENSKTFFFKMYEEASFDYYDALGAFFSGEYTNQICTGKKTPQETIETILPIIEKSIEKERNSFLTN